MEEGTRTPKQASSNKKKWWKSKTVWVNAILLSAAIAQGITGKEVLNAEAQAAILVGINLLLRIVTREQITW
jgi:hypothetical protein